MVIASLGPTLPYLAEKLDVSLSNAGVLFSARSLGYLLGSLIVGRGYDRFPGNHLMACILFLMAFMMAFIPISPFLILMAILLLVAGICMGGTDVGGNTLVMRSYGASAGPYLNALFFFAGVGGLVTPLIVGRVLLLGLDVQWAYWTLAASISPVALWLLFQPSPAMNEAAENNDSEDLKIPLLVVFGVLFFLYVSIEAGYSGWIYTYMLTLDLGSVSLASIFTSLFWLALTLGRLFAIPIAARVRPFSIARTNLLGAFLSMGLILLMPRSLLAVGIGTFGLGVSIASNLPAIYSLVERNVRISGGLTGVLWACGSAGAMFTPLFIGQLMERLGPTALVETLLIYVMLGLAVLVGLRFYTRRSNCSL